MTVLILNSETNSPTLQSVKVNFIFSRGGGIFASIRMEVMFLASYSSVLSIFIDGLWMICLVAHTSNRIRKLFKAFRRKDVARHLMDIVVLLAWTNVVLSWLNVALFAFMSHLRSHVREQLEDLNKISDAAEYREAMWLLQDVADEVMLVTSWFSVCITYMCIVLMCRSFAALAVQPRLAIVLATLHATSVDLAHFAIIIVPTFVAFAVAGMCIFGRRVEQFSSIHRSIGSCFKIAMEAEFDWQTLSEEDFWTTASWIWMFIMLIVLVMLNMVLAIIMDVYTEVRNAAGSSETVLESIVQMCRSLPEWRQRVSPNEVLQTLASLPDVMSRQELQNAFPTMAPTQFAWLVSAARGKAQLQLQSETERCFSPRVLAAMKLGLDDSHEALRRISKSRPSSGPRERRARVCVEDIIQSMTVQNHWVMIIQAQLDSLRSRMHSVEEDLDAQHNKVGPDSLFSVA